MIDVGSGGYGPKIPKIILKKVKKLTQNGLLEWIDRFDPSRDYPKSYKALHNNIEYTLYFTAFGWVLMMMQPSPWFYERYEVGRWYGFWLARLVKKSTKTRKTSYELKNLSICKQMEENEKIQL
jgi:hypothetical protein